MIIAIEGLDASGKTTQVKRLIERGQSQGTAFSRFKFPNKDTDVGQAIYGHLAGDWAAMVRETEGPRRQHHLNAMVFQSLQTMDRYAEVSKLKLYDNSLEHHCIIDRYWMSGYAYGIADGLDRDWLLAVNQALPQPQLWLYLDVPFEESLVRRPERRDLYEKNEPLLHAVRQNYLHMFDIMNDVHPHWVTLDATNTADNIQHTIWELVKKVIGLA